MKIKRNGYFDSKLAEKVCVGDIIKVKAGEIVGVDGILIETSGEFKVEERTEYGHSVQTKLKQAMEGKQTDQFIDSFLYSGSSVMKGEGLLLVLAVGENTQIQRILLQIEKDKIFNPLQENLRNICSDIGRFSINLVTVLIFFMAIKIFYNAFYSFQYNNNYSNQLFNLIIELVQLWQIKIAFCILVVPEGLFEGLSTYLTWSMAKLQEEDNITVKDIASFEYLGLVDKIVFEKTGYLSSNEESVVQQVFMIEITGSTDKFENRDSFAKSLMTPTPQADSNNPMCFSKSNMLSIEDKVGPIKESNIENDEDIDQLQLQQYQQQQQQLISEQFQQRLKKYSEPMVVKDFVNLFQSEEESAKKQLEEERQTKKIEEEEQSQQKDLKEKSKLTTSQRLQGKRVSTRVLEKQTSGTSIFSLNYQNNQNYSINSKADTIIRIATAIYLTAQGADMDKKSQKFIGNKLDCALLNFAKQIIKNFEDQRENYKIIKTYEFKDTAKRSIQLVQDQSDEKFYIYVKGDPTLLMSRCSDYISGCYGVEKMEAKGDVKQFIEDQVKDFQKQMLRTILIAYKEIQEDDKKRILEKDQQDQDNDDNILSDLIFLCITAINDPLQKDIKEQFNQIQNAGIDIYIMTGDSSEMAIQTAIKVGFIPENLPQQEQQEYVSKGQMGSKNKENTKQCIYSGQDFKNKVQKIKHKRFITDQSHEEVGDIEKFKEILKNLKVISDSQAIDKQTLVTGLLQLKHVILATGDETNDCQILQKVQCAVGLYSAPEVVLQSFNVILKNRKLQDIINLLIYGRNIYSFVRKYFQMILTTTTVLLIFIMICLIIYHQAILFPCVQIIFLNIIIDEASSYALAKVIPDSRIEMAHQVSQREYIISNIIYRNIILQSFYQISILLFVLNLDYLFKYFHDYENIELSQSTMVYTALIYMQLFSIINPSSVKEKTKFTYALKKKKLFIGQMVFIIVFYILIIKYAGQILGLTDLKYQDQLLCVMFGFFGMIMNQISPILPMCKSMLKYFKCFKHSFKLI